MSVPRKFDPSQVQGWEHESIPEYWEDVGGPENGPKLVGNPAYELYTSGPNEMIVVDGMVVEEGPNPFYGMDVPS